MAVIQHTSGSNKPRRKYKGTGQRLYSPFKAKDAKEVDWKTIARQTREHKGRSIIAILLKRIEQLES